MHYRSEPDGSIILSSVADFDAFKSSVCHFMEQQPGNSIGKFLQAAGAKAMQPVWVEAGVANDVMHVIDEKTFTGQAFCVDANDQTRELLIGASGVVYGYSTSHTLSIARNPSGGRVNLFLSQVKHIHMVSNHQIMDG